MAVYEQIHWIEGLFLQPHHLQWMQKFFLDKLCDLQFKTRPFAYGVIESKISDDELENRRVRFDRLRAIMPGGTEIRVPENTDLPSLDIKEIFASSTRPITIYIGVPLWSPTRANVVDLDKKEGWLTKRLYLTHEVEFSDENTGENPQSLMTRRINARLLLEGEDTSDMEIMPILRIIHAAGEEVGFPRRDPDYIPPIYFVDGSPVLKGILIDLTNQVLASRTELAVQITRGGFSVENLRGIQFEQMLRLQILNRFGARLEALLGVFSSLSPFHMYLELRQLMAELVGLHPDRDQFEVGGYQHDNLSLAFSELSRNIRLLLKGAVSPRFVKIPFHFNESQRIYVAELTDQSIREPNQYFLGIRTKMDPRAVEKLVTDRDQFKLMPLARINQRIFGMELVPERYPPVELPAQAGLHYFRLSPSENQILWKQIETEKKMALKWPEAGASDYEAVLYMTLPEIKEKK